MSRLIPRLLLAAAALALLPTAAGAHTELSTTVPEADASVAGPPTEVVLTFTAALQPGSQPAVRVIDPAGDDLVSAPPTLDGATVTVPLNLAVNSGEHQVDWAITAADGDDQTGSFTFIFEPTVVPQPATPQPTEDAAATATPVATPDATEPDTETEASGTHEAETDGAEASASEDGLVQADEDASSTATRALVVVAAFFAVAGVGAVMLTRGRRDGSV